MSTLVPVPVPAPSAKTLFPPNRGHAFFDAGADLPFAPRTRAFSWTNAWWLAEAALLAYDDAPNVRAHFARFGFELPGTQPLATGGSTQCYVAVRADVVIVAFRGTEVFLRASNRGFVDKSADVVRDLLLNRDLAPHALAPGCWVHRGFHRGLTEVLDTRLRPLLARYGADRPVYLTGHSLGGALATLAAWYLADAAGLYTFGAPRVGNCGFSNGVQPPAWRFVHGTDLVTSVPPSHPDARLDWLPQGYAHTGLPVWLQDDDVRFEAPAGEEPPALLTEVLAAVSAPRESWGRYRDVLRNGWAALADELQPSSGLRALKAGLIDHAPLYYALRVRNALARNVLVRRVPAHDRADPLA